MLSSAVAKRRTVLNVKYSEAINIGFDVKPPK